MLVVAMKDDGGPHIVRILSSIFDPVVPAGRLHPGSTGADNKPGIAQLYEEMT